VPHPEWPADPSAASYQLPLAGVKVLDLTRIVAGPFATMILGDLGADVIKVERPVIGDEPRRWGPPFHGETAAYFTAVNRNRRSIEIDLASDDGRRIVAQLARAADVVVENYLPGQAKKLGLPDIKAGTDAVWVSLRGAGSDGPDGPEPGVDAVVQARSGLMSVTGHPETGPAKIGVPIVDIVAGLYSAVAALAGLIARARTGRTGSTFEVPLLESGLSALMNQAANYLVAGVVSGPGGTDHPNIVPYGTFPTADGRIFLSAVSELQFSRLSDLLGRPDLVGEPAYATNADRVANRVALTEEISGVTRARPTAFWLEQAGRLGVMAAPVNDVAAALADPHVAATGIVATVDTTDGPLRVVGSPILVDGRRLPVRLPPPALGEHTADVLARLGEDPALS
jgi:crotonobetainyl-CoA:carnitine CoA-transferase CaiB-like acyl-CoA transferase